MVGSDESGQLKTPFDQLVLPDGHKDVILSLVTQHFRDRKSAQSEGDFADIVRGKGTDTSTPTLTPCEWRSRTDT